MKNIHLEHPEDSILDGTLTVLDAFLNAFVLSVKFDGAPAIVWGQNPATGNQFVGTKSVFNKRKIKINECHEDIDRNHEVPVADILHACFDALPDTHRIIQGDFIGFGGAAEYTPNTITYSFDEVQYSEIIVAPHTEYMAENDLRDAVASPLMVAPSSTEVCEFIMPDAFADFGPIRDRINFAKQMSTLVEFEDKKGATALKKDLNAFIRDGDEIVPEQFENYQLVRLWTLVKSIKDDALKCCHHHDGPDAWIDEDEIDAEGYVMHTEGGSWKLVNREEFSHANFNMGITR